MEIPSNISGVVMFAANNRNTETNELNLLKVTYKDTRHNISVFIVDIFSPLTSCFYLYFSALSGV